MKVRHCARIAIGLFFRQYRIPKMEKSSDRRRKGALRLKKLQIKTK